MGEGRGIGGGVGLLSTAGVVRLLDRLDFRCCVEPSREDAACTEVVCTGGGLGGLKGSASATRCEVCRAFDWGITGGADRSGCLQCSAHRAELAVMVTYLFAERPEGSRRGNRCRNHRAQLQRRLA